MMRKAHVENGVVTNIVAVDPQNVPGWCADWPDATEDCFLGAIWDGQTFTAPPPPDPTSADVNTERDRRILAGDIFTITGLAQPVRLTGDPTTRANTADMGQVAMLRVLTDDTTPFIYRDADNVVHTLTPAQMQELWLRGVAFVDALYQASWALKAMDPIPLDYASDTYWT